MSRKNPKYYIVLSETKNYTYGAFEFTPEGLERAEQYVRKTFTLKKEKLIILEK